MARSSFGSSRRTLPKTLAGGPLSDHLDEQDRATPRLGGLVADGNYELRATGKAILLLIEAIERSARRPMEREDEAKARPAGSR